MGSFAFTCTVSGLPIEVGDKVRYLLLTASPYGERSFCYSTDGWFPRVFPLRGKYNDYGSVEAVEDKLGIDLWLAGFQKDLVERGIGDNSCHDVAVSKGMDFGELLEAVWEHRVLVEREIDRERREQLLSKYVPSEQKGIPTFQGIQKLLKDAGHAVVERGFSGAGFMVDGEWGDVRIRVSTTGDDFGKDAQFLQKVLPLLSDYAAMLTAGTGSYANSAEIVVRVKPGTKDYHGGGRDRDQAPLLVSQAMVREDVWQLLLQERVETYSSDSEGKYKRRLVKVADVKKQARELWKIALEEKQEQALRVKEHPEIFAKHDWSLFMGAERARSLFGEFVSKSAVPFTVGLDLSFRLLVDLFCEKKVTQKQVDSWLDDAAEFCIIQPVLSTLRYYWHPSHLCGPQFGEWKAHTHFHEGLAKLSKRNQRRRY